MASPPAPRRAESRGYSSSQLAADASDDLIGVRRAYMPDVVALNRAVNQALMPAQLVGVRGRAMRREMCIRGDHEPGIDAEVAAAEDAVGELAQPYCDVEPLPNHVDIAVIAAQVDLQFGILQQKIDQQRSDYLLTECHRRADPQSSFDLSPLLSNYAFGRFELAQHHLATFEIERADLGKADATRVPIKQADA